jgi:hypothetical protein
MSKTILSLGLLAFWGFGLIEAQTLDDISDPLSGEAEAFAKALQKFSTVSTVKILISASEDSQVTLLAPTSTQFQTFVGASVPQTVSDALKPLLPYSVVLRNDSTKAVIAYTVSWTTIDKTGKRNTDYRTVWDINAFKSLIPPNSAGLVTIVGPQSAHSISHNSELTSEIAAEANRFQIQDSVAISLEAVMLEDGTASGPDPSLSIPQLKARIRSEHDLFGAVLNMDPDSVVAWLEGIKDSVKPGSSLDLSKDPYAEWYRFYQARLASRLSKIATEDGILAMLASAHSTLDANRYPD